MLVQLGAGQARRPMLSSRALVHAAIFSAVATGIFHLASLWSPILLRFEHQLGDWRTGLLSDYRPTQHPRLALVLIDESTLRREPYTSPVDRRVLARLVQKLDQLNAKTIAVDFLFYRPTERAKDDELVAALRAAKANVILAAGDERTLLNDEERAYQTEFLARVGRPVGYANIDEDPDEVVRHRLGPKEGGRFPESFATRIAETEGVTGSDPSGRIAWLKRAQNSANAFFDVNASDVLEGGPIASAIGERFKDRIVIVGGAFADRDRHRTPLFDQDGEEGSHSIHGVYLHAHIVAQLLDGRSINDLPDWPVVFLLCFLGYCLGSSLIQQGFGWMISSISTVLLIGFDLLVFRELRLVVPYMPASTAWIIGGFGGYFLGRIFGERSFVRGRS
jgi:adenylate cyclase